MHITPRLDDQNMLDQAILALATQDPLIRQMHDAGARPLIRQSEGGFAGLAQIIVGQQVSVASARAIWARVEAGIMPLTAEKTLSLSDEALRACGLSAPKQRALRAIAEAVVAGVLPLDELANWPADEAHARLVTVKGIGPWTADIYLLFCLGHGDAFPAGDLALQEAARIVAQLPARPTAGELLDMAERWRPWRGAAAKLLWAYYAIAKGRAGVAQAVQSA